jgi:hypothetical protein
VGNLLVRILSAALYSLARIVGERQLVMVLNNLTDTLYREVFG